jgi:hypothetical protein
VKGIACLEDGIEVGGNLYKLIVSYTESEKEVHNMTLKVQREDDYECLVFSKGLHPNCIVGMITYKLTCSYVFGDNEEHTIISHWEKYDKYLNSCSRIVIDGKEFPVTEEYPEQKGFGYMAQIIL